jgi:hypothetical protein
MDCANILILLCSATLDLESLEISSQDLQAPPVRSQVNTDGAPSVNADISLNGILRHRRTLAENAK